MIIVFSGTDGSGKSTQIEKVKAHLKSKGKSVVYVWSRGGYTPGFNMLKVLIRKLFSKKLPEQGRGTQRDNLIEKRSVSKLWLIIAILDLAFLYGIYIRFQSLLGKVVICDRYVGDTLIDFKRNFPNQFSPKSLLWRLLVKVAPTPDRAFLLYVPVAVSQQRSLQKNEPFPDSKETLEFRLNHYLSESYFSNSLYKKINCELSIEDVYSAISENLADGVK